MESLSPMEKIQVHDKIFRPYIPQAELEKAIDGVAARLNADYKDAKDIPLLLCVLNGAIMFTSELMKRITFPCQLVAVKLSSYEGVKTTGTVKTLMDITTDVKGRRVIIVEDIVESGQTMKRMIESLGTRNPASVHICTLFFKPDKLKEELTLDYVAFRIPDDFIVGYGLDYDGLGRELKDVYTIVDESNNE